MTGRGLGRLRGTIVMLVVDDRQDEVIAAQALRGSTVFATAKPAPDLIGPLATLPERAADKQTRLAVDAALTQLKATRARLQDKVVAPPKGAGVTPKRKVQR